MHIILHSIPDKCDFLFWFSFYFCFSLNFGLIAVTMFVSMWISNTAAVAMMCPIMQAVLEELQSVRLYVLKQIQTGI